MHGFLAAGLILAAGAAFAQGRGPMQVPVEVAVVAATPLADTLSAVGTLRADEAVTVQPEVAGRVESIAFVEGTPVDAGAVLFRLDAALIEADLREAEANLAASRRAHDRARELAARNLIAEADLDTARARLDIDRARVASARTRLAKTTIHAPFAGVAGLRQVSIGEYVEVGQALVEVVRLDPIKVDFAVPEVHLAQIAAGRPISVRVDAYGGRRFEGTVIAVAPRIDAAGRNLQLRGQLPNGERLLLPGQFARVSLPLEREDEALMVPEQALWPVGEKTFVFRVEDGVARQVPVSTGQRRPGLVHITAGLAAGDVIVTAGQLKLADGVPVLMLNPPQGAAAGAGPAE